MLAFMGTQSFIMMYQAGEGWQYGKRKQSALSNEEFNKQTPLSIMDRQRQELINALPSIKDSMNAMTPLINTIVTQYGDFLNEIIKATPEAIANAQEGLGIPGLLPLAYGEGGQKDKNPTVAEAIWKIAEGVLGMGGGLVINSPGPNPETPEEEKAANELILEQTLEEKLAEIAKLKEENKFQNEVPKQPAIGKEVPGNKDSFVKAQYQNKVFELQKTIKEIHRTLNVVRGNLKNTPGVFHLEQKLTLETKKIAKARKLLINFITQSKNNIKLKSLANNDWNKKVWINYVL